MLDLLLADDCLGQQRVAGAASQLVHGSFVEGLYLLHLADRDVGDFLEGIEAFLDQDVGNFLVNVEFLHEYRLDARNLFLALLLGILQCACGNDSFRVYAAAVYDCLNPNNSEEIPEDQWDDAYGYFVAIAICGDEPRRN